MNCNLLQLPDADMASYYSDPPSGVDLMLQNLMLSIKTHQRVGQNGVNPSKNVLSPPGSSESKKTVTFEDNGIFNLNGINITVPKVKFVVYTNYMSLYKSYIFLLGSLNRHYGKSR